MKYYLIGVGLGILMVLAIFKDRSFTSWTPKNKINAAIINTPIDNSDWLDCYLDCLDLDTNSLKELIIKGSVDYSRSEVENQKDRTYMFEFDNEKLSTVRFNISGNLLYFIDFETKEIVCHCEINE